MATAVYLRDRDGRAVGPLAPIVLDVLFGTRVIDESTPVSHDGRQFFALAEAPELIDRALRARTTILAGGDPWGRGPSAVVRPTEPAPEPSGPVPLAERSALAVLFACAASRAKGRVTFSGDEGLVLLDVLDGKVVAVDTTVERLGLGSYLIDTQTVTIGALDEAVTAAVGRFGGDVGAALIGLGKIAPHLYVEAYGKWARGVLADVVQWGSGASELVGSDVKPPPMPLGFDRASALMEAARGGLDRGGLEIRLAASRSRTVIPSSVNGLTLEDLRLPPKELRILKGIDGTKTLDEILSVPGADAAMAAIYAGLEGGFLVLGEDPEVPREQEALRAVESELAAAAGKGPLEILGVKASASDEEVRARYMALAKLHHPDRLRPGALPALVEGKRRLFAAVQTAFEAVETAEKRMALDQLKAFGVAGAVDEQAVVRAVMEAETLFKKAEILARMRKYAEALELIDQALARKPDDVEFRIHRTYWRHLAKQIDAEPAIQEISSELKKQPNVAAAYLFLGRLNKALDKPDQAVRAFKKLLELDPRSHEAETELRLASMRKDRAASKKKWL